MDNSSKTVPSENTSSSPHSRLQIQELARAAKEQISALVAPIRMETSADAAGKFICRTCNSIVRSGAVFCQNCGAKMIPPTP